jgi:hypothetical protein
MAEIPLIATRLAAEKTLRGQLHNLEETIMCLVELQKSLPEGKIRYKFMDEISAMDSIGDVMRQALDSLI